MNKVTDMFGSDLLRLIKQDDPDAVEVLSFYELNYEEGGCPTCYYTVTEFNVAYKNAYKVVKHWTYKGSFLNLLENLLL